VINFQLEIDATLKNNNLGLTDTDLRAKMPFTEAVLHEVQGPML
jgi:hypothetical protein